MIGLLAGGLGLSALGDVAGGLIGAKSTKKAIKQQNKTLKKFLAEAQRQAALVEKNTNPFITAGHRALATLTGTADENTPALPSFRDKEFYQFREDELNRSIKRATAARGQLFSGAGIEAEARGNLALSGEETQREQDLLMTLSTQGLNAATQQGQLQAQNLNSTGNMMSSIGGNIAQMTMTRGQQIAGAVAGPLQTIGGGLAGYGMQQQNNQFLGDLYRQYQRA